MYPRLSLAQIHIDPELARRIPRRLAYYHLALPIAQDEEDITVAMAYPENRRVVEVIQTALGMPVTPVRSHGDDIRRVLDTIWADEDEARRSGLMIWSANPSAEVALATYVQSLMAALTLEDTPAISHISLGDFIAQVNSARPMLAVCVATDVDICGTLISSLSTSLLILRGSFALPQTILHALRGHTPDQRALDWVIPLAQYYDAQITLLAAANSINARQGSPLMSDIARLILPEHPAQVVEDGQMLSSMNLRGRIKVADGLLEDALVQVLEAMAYDLVVIATENNGKFVQSALSRLGHNSSAFLVIKP
jgi:hypothetical protein